MNARSTTCLALAALTAACATSTAPTGRAVPRVTDGVLVDALPAGSMSFASPDVEALAPGSLAVGSPASVARPLPATRRLTLDERRAGTQPFRLRQPQNLQAGRTAAQFRGEVNNDTSGGFGSVAYGVFDNLMVSLQAGSGHQYETISAASKPGELFDFGVQYGVIDEDDFTLSTRFDLVLSDKSSFEPKAGSETASFQPSALAGLSLTDDIDLYGSFGMRFGDGVEPSFATGIGLCAELGRANLYLETDLVAQNLGGTTDILEAYLTPGLQFLLRDKVDINFAPAIGLNTPSFDWRVLLTMGVHF